MDDATQVCTRCGRALAIVEFYKNPRMLTGRLKQCKSCVRHAQTQRVTAIKAAARDEEEAALEIVQERWKRRALDPELLPYRRRLHRALIERLVERGIDEGVAQVVVSIIAAGKLTGVRIQY